MRRPRGAGSAGIEEPKKQRLCRRLIFQTMATNQVDRAMFMELECVARRSVCVCARTCHTSVDRWLAQAFIDVGPAANHCSGSADTVVPEQCGVFPTGFRRLSFDP
jgi:hypothetical protein